MEEDAIIANLKSGINSPFWQAIQDILQSQIDYLSKVILGETGHELTEAERKDLIKWRGYQKELLELPEKYIKAMEQGQGKEPIKYDPYYKNFSEILNERRKRA